MAAGWCYIYVDQAGSATDDAGGILEECRGGSKSRMGAAAWKLVLPNIFHYNISLLLTLLDFTHFDLFFPVLCLQGLMGQGKEGLVMVL